LLSFDQEDFICPRFQHSKEVKLQPFLREDALHEHARCSKIDLDDSGVLIKHPNDSYDSIKLFNERDKREDHKVMG
jgi:hypothetical protein